MILILFVDVFDTNKYDSMRVAVNISSSLLSYIIYTEYKPDYTAIDGNHTLFCFSKSSKEPLMIVYCREDTKNKNLSLLDIYSREDMSEETDLFVSSLHKILREYSE